MTRTMLASLILSSSFFVGCGATPQSLCNSFIQARKSGGWPAGEAVQKECEQELDAVQKRSPTAFKCMERCIVDSSAENTNTCVEMNCDQGDPEYKNDGKSLWAQGIASKASGAWANAKPKKLGIEECNEGALAIAGIKYNLGILNDSSARSNHQKELLEACKGAKDDPLYAEQFACLRRVTSRMDIMNCSQPGGGGDSVDVIEGCVKECTGKHGSEPTPAYMTCFNECKAR